MLTYIEHIYIAQQKGMHKIYKGLNMMQNHNGTLYNHQSIYMRNAQYKAGQGHNIAAYSGDPHNDIWLQQRGSQQNIRQQHLILHHQ